ncbi:MAG: S-layer family protein, partial [Armatimonadetes bacterium]|nr:S-layer family protein [Armatimonadota bacterium]
MPSATQGQVVYDPHPRDFATHRLVLDDGTNNGFWGILRLTGTLTSDIYIDFPADATGPVIRGNSTGGQSITGGLTVDDLALSTPLAAIYGGTGFSAYAIGDILYANTPTTLARRAIGTTGQILVVEGGVPQWSNSSVFSSTGGATPVTGINSGDITAGLPEAVTNIGYNDAGGANGPSTTNIAGNTNIGSATGDNGGPTTTTVNGNANFTGTTTFAVAPTIPLATDNIWRGVGGVQTAYAPGAAGTVLTVVGTTPTWSSSIGNSSAPENVVGGPLNLNSTVAGSPSTTNINASPATGGTTNIGNGTSTTNVAGTTNLTGPATLSGATTTISSPTTNINTAPNAGGTTTIGNPTSTTQLNGTVNFTNPPSIPLAQNAVWVGNSSNVQQAYNSTNVNGAVLAQNASGTPTWTTSTVLAATTGSAPVTNINNGDVNNGSGTESVTNIGYNDPDGGAGANAASTTNINGNTVLGSNTGSGGGPTTTTVLGTTNLQGATTNINTAPNAGGTTTIGNPTSTTQLNGTVNFTNPPSIPLAQNAVWVGNSSNVQQAYNSTNVSGAVLAQNASGTPTWSTTNNFTTTAPAGGGAVTNINTGDVNSGNNSEATTTIGYNDPDGAVATNAASQTTVLGNINLNNTSPGSTSPQTTTIGYNDPDGSGANVPSQTTILGNTNINATNPNSPTAQATTIGYNDPDGGGPNAASTTTVLGTTNLQGPTTNINTAPNAGGTTTIGNPTSTTQLNGTVNFANAPVIPLATDNVWVGVGGVQTAYPPGVAGSVLSIVGTTPTWSSANVLNATAGLAPITNINAQDNNVGGGTEAVTNIGYDDLSSGGSDNPSQTNIRGNTNLGSNNGNNGGATTTSVVGNTNINASNPNSPTTQTTTVGYNDPDGAGANVASTTNILGTTNLTGSTNNIGTTDNTAGGGPESQVTIGYNDPDGGGPNGPSNTTINGNVTFANAPAIPLATDNIWRGVGGVQTAYAPGAAGTVLTVVGTTPTWSSSIGNSSAPENVVGGPLNLNSTAAGSPSTTNINANPATGGTTNIGNGTSTTNVAGTTNLTGPATLSGATTTISSPTTNINTAPNAGGTTTIGNPTSTTQLNGTVNFANAPTIPLAT